MGGDDEEAGKEVGWHAVSGGKVTSTADDGFAAVRGEDYDWGDGGFEGAVEVGEAFDVEHVDLRRGSLLDKFGWKVGSKEGILRQ